MKPTANELAPGNTCFVVTACQRDVHYARLLLASMHWFCPEFPVIVIGDGGLKASEVSNLPNVHRFYDSDGIPASRSLLLRGMLSKLNLFFLDEFDYYVACDADSILIGNLMRTMEGQRPFDFLGLDCRGEYDMANEEHRKMYSHYVFSADQAQKRSLPLPYHALVYFQGSHFCVKRNALWAGLIEEWRPEMRTDFSPDGFLKFGDQGFLNFAVNSLGHAGRMKAKMTSVVINGKRNPADYTDVNITRLTEKTPGTMDVIHYTAHSRRLTLKAHHFGWALEFFDRHCYSLRGRSASIADKTLYFSRKMATRVTKSRPGGYAMRRLKEGKNLMASFSISDLRRIVFDPLAWELSKRELHTLMEKQDIEAIIAATEQYVGRGFYASIHAIQKFSELSSLARLVQEKRPKVIVEIGTAKGGTLYVWTRSNPQAERVVSIDLPGGLFGGGYDQRRVRLYREFAHDRPGTRMEFLRCDSHAASSLEKLKTILAGREIDFLYIDGDHAYDGVKMDFQMYGPLVSRGGLVAFHDIVTTGHGHDVSRFWHEVKARYPHEEFVQNPQGSMGLGVLHL